MSFLSHTTLYNFTNCYKIFSLSPQSCQQPHLLCQKHYHGTQNHVHFYLLLAKKLFFFSVIFAFYADSLRSFVTFFSHFSPERGVTVWCVVVISTAAVRQPVFYIQGWRNEMFCHTKACLSDIWVRKAFDECLCAHFSVSRLMTALNGSLAMSLEKSLINLLVDHDREACKCFLIELNFLGHFLKILARIFLIKLDNLPHFSCLSFRPELQCYLLMP